MDSAVIWTHQNDVSWSLPKRRGFFFIEFDHRDVSFLMSNCMRFELLLLPGQEKVGGLFDAHASRPSARWMVRKEDPGQLAQAALEKEDWCILAKKNYTTNVAFVVLQNETWANVIRGRFLTGRSSCEKRKHERSQSTIICWTRSNCCRSQNTSGWTVLLNQVSSFNQRFWVEVGRRIDC